MFIASTSVIAQDIPLFSQKLTNSFIYNPAVAGHTFGSLTLSRRKTFGDFATNNFLSIHAPIANHRFGIGANVFTEEINFIENTYASAAFAYHLQFSRYNTFSMGLSAEYNTINFDGSQINFDGGDQDPFFSNFTGDNNIDFSFGLHYQHQYFKLGFAANRLATSFIRDETQSVLSNFYSVSASGLIPIRSGVDILEPTFNFRKLRDNSDVWDIGAYYTYNNLVLVGASYRQGDILSLTAGLRIAKKIMFGYSFETPNGDFDLGNTNEFTLRFDFSNQNYQTRFQDDYKQALAFRRKTLSSASRRVKAGGRTPKSFKRNLKKRTKGVKSPNSRYSTFKKRPRNTKRYNSGKRKRSKKRKRRRYNPVRRKR